MSPNIERPRRAYKDHPPGVSPLEWLQALCIYISIPLIIILRLLGRLSPQNRAARLPVVEDVIKAIARRMGTVPLAISRRNNSIDRSPITTSPRFQHLNSRTCEEIITDSFHAYWICRGIGQEPIQPKHADVLLFHIHGGAYLFGHPLRNAPELLFLAERFAEKNQTIAILSLTYTLAPEDSFPTQLNEALAAYRYIIRDLDVEPSKIAILGESAGGHLTLSLLAYLRDESPHLPQPGMVLLISPWIDLTLSNPHMHKQVERDFLSLVFLDRGRGLLVRDTPLTCVSLYLNFSDSDGAFRPWSTALPARTWVSTDPDELFYYDIKRFVEIAREDGVDVTLDVRARQGWGGHAWQAIQAMLHRKKYLSRAPGEKVDDLMSGYWEISEVMFRFLQGRE